MESYDVAIIGGGITGLAVATQLAQAQVSFTIIERANRLGGQIQTLRKNGYTFEVGPNTAALSSPEMVELFDYLHPVCRPLPARASAKARWIWHGDHFEPLPSSLWSAVRTPLFSWWDKLRILGEPLRARGDNPLETVGELAQRRLGKSFVTNAVDPFISGVYAGDPYRLVTKYALPKLYRLEQEHGSFIRGTVAKMRTPRTPLEKRVTKEIFSVAGGLENLVRALGGKLEQAGDIRLGIERTRIVPNPGEGAGFRLDLETPHGPHQIQARRVVTTVGAHALAQVLPEDIAAQMPDQMRALTALEYAPVAELAVGFDHLPGVDHNAFGGLVPSQARRNVLGILFPSACFPGRTPTEDGALFTVFLGGIRAGKRLLSLPDAQLTAIGLAELRAMMGIGEEHQPQLVHLTKYPRAIPQYDASTPARLEAIAAFEQRLPGLILAGGIRDGIGLANRITQGVKIGKDLVASLR